MRVIDFHAHAFPDKIAEKATMNVGSHYGLTMHGNGSICDLLEGARRAGVSKTIFHATATRPAQVESINSWIAEHISDELIGFGTIHRDYGNFEKEIDRIVAMGLKGIKMHPDFQGFDADDDLLDPVYECIGSRLPILMHLGDQNLTHSLPAKLKRVLERFPRLTVIGAHLGGYSVWDEAEEYLIGKNLYLDTSSAIAFMPPEESVRLIRKHGAKKIVFGTDYPIVYPKQEIETFLSLSLTDQEREDILYNNAAELLRL